MRRYHGRPYHEGASLIGLTQVHLMHYMSDYHLERSIHIAIDALRLKVRLNFLRASQDDLGRVILWQLVTGEW